MKINQSIPNTYGEIFADEDPYIYEIILSYDDLCNFLDLDYSDPFHNVDDAPYVAFKEWFLEDCNYRADVQCLYDAQMEALDQIEDNDQYWKASGFLEGDILIEQELIKITVGREDLVMAFVLRWSGQQTIGRAA